MLWRTRSEFTGMRFAKLISVMALGTLLGSAAHIVSSLSNASVDNFLFSSLAEKVDV